MKKDNLLLICYDIKDFKNIEKLNRVNHKTIIVASDDYRVHEACVGSSYIDGITFLQKPIPYTAVAKDVILIINNINKYYEELAEEFDIFKKEHMMWPYHIEGGNNTQKIQDTLLYIKSLNTIIDQYKISEILIFSNSNYKHIEQVIYQICISKNIPYRNIQKFEINFSKKRLKNVVRPFYYLYQVISIKLKSSFFKVKAEENVALFWLFNSVKKHIDNATFINSMLKKSGLNPVLFSWRVFTVKKQQDLNIQQIEKYLDWSDIFISIWKNIQILVYRRRLIKLYSTYDFNYLDVDITDIVKPIVMYHILVEASDSYRFTKGFENFKKYVHVKIMSGDLGRQKIGLLVERTFPDNIPKLAFSTFLTGKNIYVEYMRKQYTDRYWGNFKYFVQNKIEKKNILEQINIDPQNVIIYGSFRMNNANANTMMKEYALKQLEINMYYDYYIMFDYPHQLNGYQSLEESVTTLIAVLDIIKDRKDIALIIKPHPSADISFLEIIKNRYQYPNIYYMKKLDNPIIGLTISDILITKYSTLGIEAMSMNTIIISMQLDSSNVFQLYGKDRTYLDSIFELKQKIGILAANKVTFRTIKENENKKNLRYIDEVYMRINEKIILKNVNQLIEGRSI